MHIKRKTNLLSPLFLLLAILLAGCEKNEPYYTYGSKHGTTSSGTGSSSGAGSGAGSATSQEAKALWGTWNYKDNPAKFIYLLQDGNGYVYIGATPTDESIYQSAFKWTYRGNELTLNDGSSTDVYTVEIKSENQAVFTNKRNNTGYIVNRTSKQSTTTVKYKEPPISCYIIDNEYPDRYWPLNKAVEQVQHATSSSNHNTLSLTFFGTNGLIRPIGASVEYITPYYEGIPSNWEGSYTISSQPGFWKVIAPYVYIENHNLGGSAGSLKVVKNNGYVTYDLKNDQATIHFEGKYK